MAVAFVAERGELISTVNSPPYSWSTFTPTAGNVLVAVLMGTDNAATFNVNTINGTGLTWTDSGLTAVRDNGTTFMTGEIWWATTDGSATGTVTVSWSENLTSVVHWVGEFSGVNTSAAIAQTAKDEAGTTDPNVSLGAAPASDSLCVAAYMGFVDANQVAEAGWTSQLAADTQANPTQGFGVWVSTAADQTFTASGTDGNHYSMIAEIAAPAAATPSLVVPSMSTMQRLAATR